MKGFAILTKRGKLVFSDDKFFFIYQAKKEARDNVIEENGETFAEVEITIKKKED
jgi:hypothetical protein